MNLLSTIKIPILQKVKINPIIFEATMIIFGCLFLTLCSKIAIPFFPVPMTLQTFSVLLIGMIYGSKRGLITILSYIMLGVIGLPVFAGPSAGILYLLNPTGGFIFGFAISVFVVGLLSEKKFDRKIHLSIISLIIGNIIIYISGLLWLSTFIGFNSILLENGLYPFIIGDLAKIAAVMWILPLVWRFINKNHC